MPVRHASRRAIVGWVLFDWAAQPFFTLDHDLRLRALFRLARSPATRSRARRSGAIATAAAGLVDRALLAGARRRSPTRPGRASRGSRPSPRSWSSAACAAVVRRAGRCRRGHPARARSSRIGVDRRPNSPTVFNNAMMPTLVPPEPARPPVRHRLGGRLCRRPDQPRSSSLGFLAADPETGKTLLGIAPLFGLDPALREGDRAIGPLTALWYIVFVLPLFLFTPDRPAAHAARRGRAHGLARARRRRCATCRSTATSLRFLARPHDLHRRRWSRCSPSAASTPPACSAGRRSSSACSASSSPSPARSAPTSAAGSTTALGAEAR